MKNTPETVVLVNFGCSSVQQIARAIRDCNIYTMVMPSTTPDARLMQEKPVGLIYCGDIDTDAPTYKQKLLRSIR